MQLFRNISLARRHKVGTVQLRQPSSSRFARKRSRPKSNCTSKKYSGVREREEEKKKKTFYLLSREERPKSASL